MGLLYPIRNLSIHQKFIQMKKISPIAVFIAILSTALATVIAFYVPCEDENVGVMLDILCAFLWLFGLLTAYAEQTMYAEQKRTKRWEEF
jgi:uncharacterized membrane protein